MKTLVIYKSKTGYTKKYADWIAEELTADILDVSKANSKMLLDYDTIIFGGSLHAVGIDGKKFIINNLRNLKDKKVVIFATGASPAREETIKAIKNSNFTTDQLKIIRFFYLRGGFDFRKLKLIDKMLMRFLKYKLSRRKELNSDEKGMLSIYNKPVDYTKKNNITELINYVNS